MKQCCVFLLSLWLLLVGFSAHSHDARPVLIQFSELSPQTFHLLAKIPNAKNLLALPELSLPQDCTIQNKAESQQSDGIQQKLSVRCDKPLQGREVGLTYPVMNPGLFTLFRYQAVNGESFSSLQPPDELSWKIPEEVTGSQVFMSYGVMGVEHIWLGIDHLLFVACLVLLTVGSWRKLLWAVTGFTVAHSLTLGLASLKIVLLPIAPVEAMIALSILFLATEIARNRRSTLTWRRPVLVSSSFGLLHGFGFAAVLQEIGLPQTEFILALLAFNLGVELGQLLFIAVMLICLALLYGKRNQAASTDKGINFQSPYAIIVIYCIGSLSAFWTIERLMIALQ